MDLTYFSYSLPYIPHLWMRIERIYGLLFGTPFLIPSDLILTIYFLIHELTTVKKCDKLRSVSTSMASLDCSDIIPDYTEVDYIQGDISLI